MAVSKKWKSFDFGPEGGQDEALHHPVIKRRKLAQNSNNKSKLKSQKNILNFYELIVPRTPADLIVHPKKIQELDGWLQLVTETSDKTKTHFLLLTGPTGSGKTSSVQILCKARNIEVLEWTNPVDLDFELYRGQGQVARFLDFFSDSKYCSLFSTNSQKKVLLIKDFPNALIRNSDEFFNVLEDVYYKATHPVVFICTDSTSTETNLARLLFPEKTLMQYSISHFSFNPCATTLLKKGLKRATDLLQSHAQLFRQPSKDILDAIMTSSMGDVRCAMNQLYLASLIGEGEVPLVETKGESGKKHKRSIKTISHMLKDETLGLFHGLGRILNPKRVEKGKSFRLNCDIEKLITEFSIQPSMFASFLFENYLKYFGDLEDVAKAADVLSCSTQLLRNWEHHDTLVVALWIAVLGVMVCNAHKASKWNQIRAPKKLRSVETGSSQLHSTDRYYYNLITKSEKYHTFKCDF